MIGGAYLCFEGAEKVFHKLFPHADHAVEEDLSTGDPVRLEEDRVRGAIKTDFILSAEIMTIALAAIPDSGLVTEAVTLAAVGIAITAFVYGGVAVIVKMDDLGLHMATKGRLATTRAFGRGLVRGMPKFLAALATVGTAAMLWVGGSIVIHGFEVLGFGWLGHLIHDIAHAAGMTVTLGAGLIEWFVKAALDGAFGLVLGIVLIPLATRVIGPLIASLTGKKSGAH
jgi:predicted DNA repair protein MutK